MKWTDQEERRIKQATALGSLSPETVIDQTTRFIEKTSGIGTPAPSFDRILLEANSLSQDKNHGPTHARRKKDKIRFRLR